MSLRFLFLCVTLIWTTAISNPRLEGEWMIELKPTGATLSGLLQIERDGDDLRAFVEGGPAPLTVDGNHIDVLIDTRDIRGFVYFLRLSGELQNEQITGTFSVESDAKVNASNGVWHATRHTPTIRPKDPDPVDMTGTWKPAPGVDFRKYTMALTTSAEAWLDDYLMHYDQPNVRCVSPGITAMVAWGAYPFEILSSQDRLTFIYEFDSEVRRIFLDGRQAPEFYQPSGMGFSTASWEGKSLVVETSLLSQNIRDFRGEPVSENARLEEVYSLSEDGKSLHAVITLFDPDNYERPPVRRRQWMRSPATEFYPNECDPDSFYRQMYNENLLDMYFERSRRRF